MGDLIQLDDYRPHVVIAGARFGSGVHVIPIPVVIAWLKGQCQIDLGDASIILREYVANTLVDDGAITESDLKRYAKTFRARQRRAPRSTTRRDAPARR